MSLVGEKSLAKCSRYPHTEGDSGFLAAASVKIMYEPQPRPALIEALTHTKVTKVACGHNHTLALDDKGAAYSWGMHLLRFSAWN